MVNEEKSGGSGAGGGLRLSRVAISVYFFCMGMTFASWASRIPDIKGALGLSDGLLGILLFAIPGAELMIMPLTPRLINRRGSRWACRVYLPFYMAVLVAIGLMTNFVSLFVTLMFFGVGSILIDISVNAQACALETDYGRPIMSSFHGMWSLGALAGGLIGLLFVWLATPLWVHFWAVALLGLVLSTAVTSHLLGHDLKPQRQAEEAQEHRGVRGRIDTTIILLGLIAFGGMFCEGTIFDWSGVYFSTVVCPPAALVRAGYIAGITAMTGGRFLADGFVRRWGPVRVLRSCALLIIAGLTLATALPYLGTATAGFFLVGAGIAPVVPVCFSAAGHSPRFTPAAAIAMVSSISFFGFLVGPPLIGLIADGIGLRGSLAIAATFGLIIFVFARATRHKG